MPESLKVIIPHSHNWTTLGTGGGIETFLKMLIEGAEKSGLALTLICAGPRELIHRSVHFLPIMPKADSEVAFVRQVEKSLRRNGLVFPREAVVLANAEHYAWAFRRTPNPVVLMSHGAVSETLRLRHGPLFVKLFQRFIERQAVSRARRIIAINRRVARYYLEKYPWLDAHKVVEIDIGVNLREFENRPRLDPFDSYPLSRGRDTVLFVGRLFPEKNVQLFLQACDELVRIRPSLQAIVIGAGPDASRVREWAKTRPWIRWLERIPHDDVLDLMSVSKALAVTSTYEGLPTVMLEAIASGLPVVSTNVGRAPELLRPPIGRIVAASPKAFVDALADVLTWNKDEVLKALELVRPLINFENTIRSIASILREVQRAQRTEVG
jgi:glycosyltransferase involved in cell wall biosynthesis